MRVRRTAPRGRYVGMPPKPIAASYLGSGYSTPYFDLWWRY